MAFSLILKLFLKLVSVYVTKFILNFSHQTLQFRLDLTLICMFHNVKPLDTCGQIFPEV